MDVQIQQCQLRDNTQDSIKLQSITNMYFIFAFFCNWHIANFIRSLGFDKSVVDRLGEFIVTEKQL